MNEPPKPDDGESYESFRVKMAQWFDQQFGPFDPIYVSDVVMPDGKKVQHKQVYFEYRKDDWFNK